MVDKDKNTREPLGGSKILKAKTENMTGCQLGGAIRVMRQRRATESTKGCKWRSPGPEQRATRATLKNASNGVVSETLVDRT